jgi:carboxyl-terminal processing protease
MSRRNALAVWLIGLAILVGWRDLQGAAPDDDPVPAAKPDDAAKNKNEEKEKEKPTDNQDKPKDEMMELYGLFVDAVEQVEHSYARKVDRRELIESALRGMLQNLDPHSGYFSGSEWRQFEKQINGSFPGIGISVEIDEESGRLRVLAPLPGSPAYAAGILPGDLIMEVDGQSTEGMTREKANEVLQGQPGTPVKLSVLHEGGAKPDYVTVTRAIIDVPSVLGDARKPDNTWDFMLDKEKRIGYLRVTGFTSTTIDDLKKALEELKEQGMKALIVDLRDDPGGLLNVAVEMSDLFLEDGLIVTTKGRNQRDQPYRAVKEGTFELPGVGAKFPLAVLVNQSSASASEIVAACLQDHKRAAVVGHRTFGKGSVQHVMPLNNGESILKLTVATYWRPSGKNIHRFKNAKDSDEWGVSPDPGLEVNLSEQEYGALLARRRERDLKLQVQRPRAEGTPNEKPREDDPEQERKAKPVPDRQLAKAVEVVKNKLAEPAPTARN